MNLGQLIPQYSTVSTGAGRGGQVSVNNGITGFISPGANDTTISYDLFGNKTGQTQNQHGGGGFLGDLISSVGSGVSDFLSDPAKATTNLFENPGVKEAALIAATIYAPELLGNLGTEAAVTGAGADVAADTLGSGIVEGGGLDALATGAGTTATPAFLPEAAQAASTTATLPTAATGALPVTEALTEFGGYPSLDASEMAAYPTSGIVGPIPAAASGLTAAELAASEMAAYPTSGIVGPVPETALTGIAPLGVPSAAELTSGLNFADLTKGASTINSLLNSFKQGATLGSLDGSSSSGSSNGSRLGSDLARVGQMGSGNSLLHAVQGLYSGSPTGFAEGGSTSSGLDNYNPLKGDTVKVGDVGKNITLSKDLASLYGDNVLAHGGQPHVDPRLMALIRARANPADKQHPNYDGTPVFRTGGLEGLGGKYVEGKGDGTSDDITAMLANGEYVFSADVVSALGNGSNKAGAEKLNDMVHSIRARARSAPPDKLPPDAKSPLEYLKPSKGKQA